MDALGIAVIRVAGRTRLDHPNFIPLPRRHRVDVFMAVFALNVVDKMGACIMLHPFFLMTSMAGHGFSMDPSPFRLPMGFDICDIIVAAVTGIGPMNGLGKFPLADLCVTTQTFRIVNTFVAVLPALDNKLLRFFRRLSGFGHLRRLDHPFIR